MRRPLLAFAISLLLHVAAVGVAVGVGLWQTATLIPRVKMQAIAVEVNDLPLGAPRPAAPRTASEPTTPEIRKPRVRAPVAHHGVTIPVAPDAGVPEPKRDAAPGLAKVAYDGGGSVDGGRRRPGDLRQAGPEGSRVVALLRVDRLRASADAEHIMAAVDRLLLLLPDRRRLIEGSGLDLYRDFDSLLIATPNPADDAVTFLAARHHLGEPAFKAALERGAKAAKKPIDWRTVEGRPVGIRQQDGRSGFDRDDRLLVLPAPTLAIMATPAYAAQLLGSEVPKKPRPSHGIDGGADQPRGQPKGPDWAEIVQRIEAEDSALPDDAAFMLTASNLFGGEQLVVPPSRGQSDDQPPHAVGSEREPPPQALTLLVGVEPAFVEISIELENKVDADRWERDLPGWKRKLATHPIVILSGFSPLISRADISRDDETLRTRIELSPAELQRLLNVVANLTQSMLAGQKPN